MSPGRRATALGLALALVALLILALLRLGAVPPRPPGERSLSTFTVLPEGEQTAPRPRREARRAAAKSPPPPAAKPPPLPPAPLPNPAAPNMIVLSRDEMASADIGKMPSAAKGDGQAEAGDDSAAAGTAPGGQPLYQAEWYREPPPNALALYLPRGAPAGAWATIACRTIERYHVDSCQQLDDSPPSLGLFPRAPPGRLAVPRPSAPAGRQAAGGGVGAHSIYVREAPRKPLNAPWRLHCAPSSDRHARVAEPVAGLTLTCREGATLPAQSEPEQARTQASGGSAHEEHHESARSVS